MRMIRNPCRDMIGYKENMNIQTMSTPYAEIISHLSMIFNTVVIQNRIFYKFQKKKRTFPKYKHCRICYTTDKSIERMTFMKKARIAVIGAGGIARSVHLPSLSELPNCEIVAIADSQRHKAEEMAQKYQIPNVYGVHYELLAQEKDLDGILCLVNPDCTMRVAYDCLQAGNNILTEKPAGLDSYQAHSLARCAARNGKIAAVAMNRRHIPLVQEVLKKVRAAGPILQIDGRFMKYSNIANGWFYASAFNCDIIHALDLVRYAAQSEPTAASTVISRFNSPVDNAWNSVFRFENGIVGTLRANYQASGRVHDLEVHGSGASAFINLGFAELNCDAKIIYNDGVTLYSAAAAGIGKNNIEFLDGAKVAGGDKDYQYYGYKSEDIDFIDCILNGKQPLCTMEDAAKSMDMAEFLLKNAI